MCVCFRVRVGRGGRFKNVFVRLRFLMLVMIDNRTLTVLIMTVVVLPSLPPLPLFMMMIMMLIMILILSY